MSPAKWIGVTLGVGALGFGAWWFFIRKPAPALNAPPPLTGGPCAAFDACVTGVKPPAGMHRTLAQGYAAALCSQHLTADCRKHQLVRVGAEGVAELHKLLS